MTHQPERLSSKVGFKGSFIEVVTETFRNPDGAVVDREVVKHPGAVAVVGIADGAILMVRQLRHAVGDRLLEIPAGKLDAGEDPWDAARRELTEETGYGCKDLVLLASFFTTPGFSDERMWLFHAHELEVLADAPTHDGDEQIFMEWLPLHEAQEAIASGMVQDAKSIIGILMVLSSHLPEELA